MLHFAAILLSNVTQQQDRAKAEETEKVFTVVY